MKQKKSCSNCIKGTGMPINNDIFCREKGIVSPDYSCSRHKVMPDGKTFKEMNFKCIDCENFIFSKKSKEGPETIGLCQLFSFRQFNGEEKGACSKFAKRREREIV